LENGDLFTESSPFVICIPGSNIFSDGAQRIDGSGEPAVRRRSGTLAADPGEHGADFCPPDFFGK